MTATLAELHRAWRTALQDAAKTPAGQPTITVFDGEVPTAPPTEATGARVLPYFVLWGGIGRPAPERAVTERPQGGAWWATTVTVAGGQPLWVLGAVDVLRAAAAGLVLPGGGVLSEDPDGPRELLKDPDLKPTRWYLPVRFTALLP